MDDVKGSTFKRYECKTPHDQGEHKKNCKVTWWARVRYIDPEKGPQDRCLRAESKADAKDKGDKWVREIEETAGRSIGSERMTFDDLCTYYENHYLKEAEYVGDRKVAGMRSYANVKTQLPTLKTHFGPRRLRSISYGNIREFRAARFKVKTKSGTQRSIASVNRQLALLRRMLNVAAAEGWITKNPFNQGESLITIADEKKRERILTREEEKNLLEACSAPKRAHLRAIVIAALDTGCRLGELLKLRWRDVDLDTGQINLIAFNTKTARARTIAMTMRLKSELERLKAEARDEPSLRVFGILTNVKRSFTGARNDAGLPDLRFHDLRHSAATRLVQAHIPLSEVGRILGHSQANTTYRYVNADHETAQRAATALDIYNDADNQSQAATSNELVN